ncbi:MAG: hypothetical protein LCH47_13290 [Proteobacteria bacterium]|nr:hypothetical protein [Pseudomonadota bacterium]
MSEKLLFAAAGALLAGLAFSSPASALTMKECSAKYQAAKTDGTANGVKWNDFRAKFCGSDAAAEETADEKDVAATPDKEPEAPTAAAPKGVKFPKAVDKKYAAETAGKARMKTCVDSYHANKDAGTLDGLKWIQKGGGYWSLCSAALKKAGG